MEQNTNGKTNWCDEFSLYQALVKPFKAIEDLSSRKRKLEMAAGNAKEIIGFGYKRTIREAFSHTLKWAIPFLIVFWVITNVIQVNGEKLFYYYDEPIEVVLGAIEEILFEEGSAIFEIAAAFSICVPFPCLIFLFPLMIVGCVISRIPRISKAKKTLKDCEEQLIPTETAIQEIRKKIAPYVERVPQGYRNSNALAFFSDSFRNSKAKNVQEAIKLYDTYLSWQEELKHAMELSEIKIMEQERRDRALDDISRQLDHIQDQIDSQEPVVNNYYYY